MTDSSKSQIAHFDEMPESLHGYQFKTGERQKLSQGEKVFVENMLFPDNTLRDGYLWMSRNRDEKLEVSYQFKSPSLTIEDKILNHRLSKEEKEELQKGKVVGPLQLTSDFKAFLQIDEKLNKVVIRSHQELGIPKSIGGYVLSEVDQNKLANNEAMQARVFKGDKGYFVANFKLTDDQKGHEYINIKDLSKYSDAEIKRLIGDLNKDASVVDNILSVSNNVIEQGKEKPLDKSSERANAPDQESNQKNSGVLIDHGPAPFENDPTNSQSYFVKVKNDLGEKTIWGIDLKRAIEESGVKSGEAINLENLGRQPVVVKAPVKDSKGAVIDYKEIDTHRNTWKVEKVVGLVDQKDQYQALEEAIVKKDFNEISRLGEKHPFEADKVGQLIEKHQLNLEETKAVSVLTKTEISPSQQFKTALKEQRYADIEKIIDKGYSPSPEEKVSFKKAIETLSSEQRIEVSADRLSKKILSTEIKMSTNKEKQHRKGIGMN